MNNFKDELNSRNIIMDELVNKHKKDFEGLNEKQKTLLAYRKIMELPKENKTLSNIISKEKVVKENSDELLAIIKAANYDCGIIKPIILYSMCNNKDYKSMYKESLISYNKILQNYKNLAKELNIERSLELSHLFTYMLWNGYFSITKTHSYKLKDRLLLPDMHSFDTIKGNGVCLAYSELLRNYLNICDKKAAILNCKMPTDKKEIQCDYRPEIERKQDEGFSNILLKYLLFPLTQTLQNKVGNHAVTLIEENGKIYIYDPTNLFVLNVEDENTATLINGKGQFDLKPLNSLVLSPNSDPYNIYAKMFDENIEKAFTRKEIIFSYENTIELIKNNINLLDDAYDNIHSELEVINNQTNEIGGYLKVLRKNK